MALEVQSAEIAGRIHSEKKGVRTVMFWWERVYPPHHIFFHNGSGSHRLLPSAVIHAQSCPRCPPPAPTEVTLWSTTFPFVSVWIIDEAGEAQPKRLQAEWIVKEVQGVDGITQSLRLEALWTEYLPVYVIFLIDSSFNLQKVRNVKKKYHWCFLETQSWPLHIDRFIQQAVGKPKHIPHNDSYIVSFSLFDFDSPWIKFS